jgi:hypothetical protein
LQRSRSSTRTREGTADRGQTLTDYALFLALIVAVLYLANGPFAEEVRPLVRALADGLKPPWG